jgi:plastocyanin
MKQKTWQATSSAPLLGALLVTLLATADTNAAADAAKSSQRPVQVITIEGIGFKPENLTVQRGDRVQWINKDLVPHTATATGGPFDSKVIAADGSWTWVASESGTFAYVCSFHPMMKGTLTVR